MPSSIAEFLYETFAAKHPDNRDRDRSLKPLRAIVQDLTNLVQNKQVVCYHIQHDLEVLQFSPRQRALGWFAVVCTWERARQH